MSETDLDIDTDALTEAYERALAHEKAGRAQDAKPLYEQCLAIDSADRVGASIRLASLGLRKAPPKAPDAYIEALFDQHADDFDDILTGQLGYAVPMQLAQWFETNAPGPFPRMLDLGCGTGLVGMMLGDMCDHATGVDIAEKMVEAADERAAYDALFVNEAVHFLREYAASSDPEHIPFDLIVAADVLPYIGALEPLFDALASNANPGAMLAISSETLPNLSTGWKITPNQRYAHSKHYLEQMCARSGFLDIESFEDITVRTEQSAPIPGYLIVASRPD
ncbi:MAG: methyltransferase [Pseudomonadota bacterium]